MGTVAAALLLRRRNAAIRSGLRSGFTAAAIAAIMSPELRLAILEARGLAASAAVARIKTEAKALEIEVEFAAAPSLDVARASIIAKNYARQWRDKAAAADTESAEAAARAASELTRGALDRIAITESSIAYNEARLDAAREALPDTVLRRWETEFSKNTCEICDGANGTVVGLHEDFPDGEPGSVHPSCACSWSIVTVH